jgi:hypothetical protein
MGRPKILPIASGKCYPPKGWSSPNAIKILLAITRKKFNPTALCIGTNRQSPIAEQIPHQHLQGLNNASDPEKYLHRWVGSVNVLSLKTKIRSKSHRQYQISIATVYIIIILHLAVYCSDNLPNTMPTPKTSNVQLLLWKSLEFYRALNNAGGINYCLSNLGALKSQEGNNSRAADTLPNNLILRNKPTAWRIYCRLTLISQSCTNSNDPTDSKNHWSEALKLSNSWIQKLQHYIIWLGSTSFKNRWLWESHRGILQNYSITPTKTWRQE